MTDEIKQACGFIKADMERELQLAELSMDNDYCETVKPFKQQLGAGNFLCAISLFSYIEFLGKIKYAKTRKQGERLVDLASANFNCQFDDLGNYYKTFRISHNVYDLFRCGLVHEYYVKGNCCIYMFGDKSLNGIGFKDSQYYIIIENLFNDYITDFEKFIKKNEK